MTNVRYDIVKYSRAYERIQYRKATGREASRSGCVRTETKGVNKIVLGAPRPPFFPMLSHQNHGIDGIQSLTEPIALFCQGNILLHRAADPKELAHLCWLHRTSVRKNGETCAKTIGLPSVPSRIILE